VEKRMKNAKMIYTFVLFAVCALLLPAVNLQAVSDEEPQPKDEYLLFKMENNYFSCEIPKNWELKRDREKERKSKVYKIELLGPRVEKAPVIIYVAYYDRGNNSFKDHADFIERNSKNILGESRSDTEKFSPVRKTMLNKKKAFEFESEIQEYLHPESKSSESVVIKEKFYVIPAKKGFFVLHYFAPKSVFARHLGVFSNIVRTFTIING
jgi:hypothetical protein